MSKSISILLPTYNCSCVALVTELQRQCVAEGIPFEILVADDASPDRSFITKNEPIKALEGVRYILREKNVGRSAIRNFLISQAQNDWLLFIDGDLSLLNPQFIHNYVQAEGEVVVGGISIGGDPKQWKNNLRYVYEQRYEATHNAAERQQTSTQHFRTTNFLAHKTAMSACPFDESFKQYGYEDVLLGKAFEEQGIKIKHIDNPITLDDFEPNDVFIAKTEESLRTLSQFKNLLQGYSHLLSFQAKMQRFHLLGLLSFSYILLKKTIKPRLIDNKPNVFLFNIYKLLYFTHFDTKHYD